MSNLVNQSKLRGTQPVVFNVENFTKPAPGQPALISFDDVTTMFHEFGHALHGMFASADLSDAVGHQRRPRLRRVPLAVQRELGARSQGAAALRRPLPDRPADPAGAGRQDQGRARPSTRAMRMARCWRRPGSTSTGIRCRRPRRSRTSTSSRPRRSANGGFDIADVPPRYRSSYFLHIWGNGYSAGYYAYPWTRMLGQDAFALVRD